MNTRSSSNKSKRIGFEIYSDISENRKKRTLSNKDGNKAHKSSSKSSKIVGLDGGTVFGWILVVFAIFGLIGFFIYHKKGSSSGATDYGHLGTI